MQYIILRAQTDVLPNILPETVVIKFFPVRNKENLPLTVFAGDGNEALKLARTKFPFFHCFLAVEEKESYDRTTKRLSEGRVNAQRKTTRPRNESADTVGGKNPH